MNQIYTKHTKRLIIIFFKIQNKMNEWITRINDIHFKTKIKLNRQ